MLQYHIYCTSYSDIQKTEKCYKCTLNTCMMKPSPILVNDQKDISKTLQTTTEYQKELDDCFYIIWWFLKPSPLNFQLEAILFQYLSEAFYCNQVKDSILTILSYVQQFKLVITKENFDTLPSHHKWDHAIKLVLGEPKIFNVYSLFTVEQTKLNVFITENFCINQIISSKLHWFFYQEKGQLAQVGVRLQNA